MKAKIDYKEITKLIDLLEERNLSQFELEVEGLKIKISRSQPKGLSPASHRTSPVIYQNQHSPLPSSSEPSPQEEANNLHVVTSPMVGTFYRAPDPSSPSFVEVGDQVTKNQTLCIIEAMKLMNEIEADVDGIVEEIFVESGSAVEYGQKLFSLKPLS